MVSKGNAKRGGAPKTLAQHAGRLTKPIFGGRGFADGALLGDWPTIAGALLAAHSAPEKITYPQGRRNKGTLHLRVDMGGLAMEIQHQQTVLMERINAYFGYAAVEHIRITQGPLPERPPTDPPPPRALSEPEEENLLNSLSAVRDPDIHDALERLGRGVLGKTSKEKP